MKQRIQFVDLDHVEPMSNGFRTVAPPMIKIGAIERFSHRSAKHLSWSDNSCSGSGLCLNGIDIDIRESSLPSL